jgi:ribosomal protein L23
MTEKSEVIAKYKEMLVFPVNKVANKKIIIGKWGLRRRKGTG